MEAFFFWILAVVLVICAGAVIANKNPVASALCLAATFICQAALFITLQAFFLAAVQVIVYAGAVMVLFLFIIMLFDIKAQPGQRRIPWGGVIVTIALAILIGSYFGQAWLTSFWASHNLTILDWTNPSEHAAQSLGELLFGEYLLPCATTAILLLLATVGAVLLSKKNLSKIQ